MGNASIPQGAADRNRLEIAYRTPAGQIQWGQMVIHGPTGNVGIGTVSPQARLHVQGDIVATGDVRVDGADCVEEFELAVQDPPKPGTVMVFADDGRSGPASKPTTLGSQEWCPGRALAKAAELNPATAARLQAGLDRDARSPGSAARKWLSTPVHPRHRDPGVPL